MTLKGGTGLDLCLLLRVFDRDTPILFATAASSLTESQAITGGAQRLVKMGIVLADDSSAKVTPLLKS